MKAALVALIALVALVLSLAGCVSNDVYTPVNGRGEFNRARFQQLQKQSEQAREALIDEHGLYAHASVLAYVQEIGQKIAAKSHWPELPWSFTILDTELSNAFSLPGGQVFVTRGLLAHLQSEAELAAVLGHEIAHVTAQHGAQRVAAASQAAAGVGFATQVGEFFERQGLRGASDRLKGFGLSLAGGWVASYSREQEFEADRIGADYVARAGYDMHAMAGVLQTLHMIERFEAERVRQPVREAARSPWLASHPALEQRLREAERFTAMARQIASDGRLRYLERIDGLVYGDSPDRGLVREQLFVHPRAGYAITAPPRWEIEVEGSAAVLRSPDGDSTLTVRLLPRSAGRTTADAIQKVLTPTEGRGTARGVGSFKDGMHFVGSRLQDGVRRPLRATLVAGPGGRHFLLDYSSRSGEFSDETLKAMTQAEQSFRAVAPTDRRAAREWRLGRVAMPAGGFAALARDTPLGEGGQAELRVLNGLFGLSGSEAEPAVGTTVKTVR